MSARYSKMGSRMAHPATIFVGRQDGGHFSVKHGTGVSVQPPFQQPLPERHWSRFQVIPFVPFDLEEAMMSWLLDTMDFDMRNRYCVGSEACVDTDDEHKSASVDPIDFPMTEYWSSDDGVSDSDVDDELVRSAKKMKLSDDSTPGFGGLGSFTPQTRVPFYTSPVASTTIGTSASSSDPFGSSEATRVRFGEQHNAFADSSHDLPQALMDKVKKVVVKTYYLK